MYQRPQIHDITRKANGIGIVCGLEVVISADCTLTLTAGYGFTSTGKLLHFPGGHFKYYRPYQHDIKGLLKEEDEIPVWELFEKIEGHAACQPLTPQTIDAHRFIDEKVVLLYLESGYYNRIKPLLIEKEALWDILNANLAHDIECLPIEGTAPEDLDLFEGEEEFPNGRQLFCAINRNTSLSPIYLMRFGFATDENECRPEEREFKILSPDFEGLYKEYELIILDALFKLQVGIKKLHDPAFHDLIPTQQRHYLEKYFEYLKGDRWISFKTAPRNYYIQYFHDLIKDLTISHNELVGELCELMADCCPDENLFPYHLLLGEIEEDISFGPSIFRHHFRQPPIYNDNRLRYQKIRFLHWRMAMQIKNFYLPFVESSDFADDHYAQIDKNDEVPDLIGSNDSLENIKVTPSRLLHLPLGQQAIPFYYYVGEDANSMHHFWDFEAVFCCKKQHQLSYHAEEDYSYTNECAVQRPQAYNNYPHVFYRIEGAIGQTYEIDDPNILDTPVNQIQALILRFNLGFKVRAVSIDEFFIDYPLPAGDGDFQINTRFLGAEHLGGAEKGGYYLLVYQEFDLGIKTIVADYWVPYCCVEEIVSNGQGSVDVDDGSTEFKGRIFDACNKVGMETTFQIGTTAVQSSTTGAFSVRLMPGDYTIRLDDRRWYLQENTISVPVNDVVLDEILIKVFPRKRLTVVLKHQGIGITTFKNEVILKGKNYNKTKSTSNINVDWVIFDRLEAQEYTVEWKGTGVKDSLIIKACDEVVRRTLTAPARRAFPPDVDDLQWPEWGGLSPVTISQLATKYKENWTPRIQFIQSFTPAIAEESQAEIFPHLASILYDFSLTAQQLTESYDQLMLSVQKHSQSAMVEAWASFGQNLTEMYLERLVLVRKDFDPDLHTRIAKLPELGVLKKEELEGFIQSWLAKVKGYINPVYEDRFKTPKLTPINKVPEKIRLTSSPNLTEVFGIGKKTQEYLHNKGVKDLETLAQMKTKTLNQLLEGATLLHSARLMVNSWPEQAQLILTGDLKKLKSLQQEYRKKSKKP